MLVAGLSTDHKVGLAVVGGAFIAFALASAFLFPRFRRDFPAHGLLAFIVVAFVFFFGMLTAVEVFGAESKKPEHGERAAATESQPASTATTAPTTTVASTTTQAASPATTAAAKAQTVEVDETEFKITLASGSLHAGKVTFQIKNTGQIAHDLTIAGGPKSKLIAPGGSATLDATLKSGTIELYCSVPGHKQNGMDLKTSVS